MKNIRLIPLILVLCSLSLRAQDNDEIKAKLKTSFQERLGIKVEYFGELILHPGLSVGMDYAVVRHKWLTVHWDANLGGYWHCWNNTSVFMKTSIGSRFVMGPVFTDINLGVGYMHSWAAGVIYERTEEGDVEQAANWGHPHFMPNASFLIGWKAGRKSHLPITVHIGPEVYFQSSFNHIYLPHVAAKIGFTYKLN